MDRGLTWLTAALGFSGVALGAFGAHGLKSQVESLADGAQRLGWWDLASRYQLLHALAVGLCAVLAGHTSSKLPKVAAWTMTAGVAIFCGSLYVMALTGLRGLGAVTPLGGISMLVGWTLFGLSARRLSAKQGT
jgi:uncharacterized membrane protein YgdD (TMEM256/DUF423 family)